MLNQISWYIYCIFGILCLAFAPQAVYSSIRWLAMVRSFSSFGGYRARSARSTKPPNTLQWVACNRPSTQAPKFAE
ncbi:hypothetical protein BGX38DRAFT_823760 [Terfezia claveryi]|nr:hypothetical protein BGX38DRAFT_823760 [Terfezia claveryi]